MCHPRLRRQADGVPVATQQPGAPRAGTAGGPAARECRTLPSPLQPGAKILSVGLVRLRVALPESKLAVESDSVVPFHSNDELPLGHPGILNRYV
jgi:hypothetical protein